jgi:hypothetical protein
MQSHAAALPAPRLVPRPAASSDHGASRRANVVDLPQVRDRSERHALAPAPECGRDVRSLCCEGSCSADYAKFQREQRALIRVGYSAYNLRAQESASLAHTPHYFIRTEQYGQTVYLWWACVRCGCERIYGAEEA